MSKTRKFERAAEPAWGTASERIKWLVETRFDDNRSAMAKAIGFSHAIVGRVVAGTKPGRRFLEAVVRQLHVNPTWLEWGEGQPFSEVGSADRGIPVSNMLLSGPPAAHQSVVLEWLTVPEVVPSPSAYWLALKSSQPIVRRPASGFRTDDHLLMETDPAKFPKETALYEDLCVVRGGAGGSALRLATVEHRGGVGFDDEDPHIEADYHAATNVDQTVVENVYRHLPNGDVRHVQHRRLPGRGEGLGIETFPPVIRYADIVSVWLKILRRPLG